MIALPLLIWYPINRASHARILAQLAERKALTAAGQPAPGAAPTIDRPGQGEVPSL